MWTGSDCGHIWINSNALILMDSNWAKCAEYGRSSWKILTVRYRPSSERNNTAEDVSLCGTLMSVYTEFSISLLSQCCAYALLRFRHKKKTQHSSHWRCGIKTSTFSVPKTAWNIQWCDSNCCNNVSSTAWCKRWLISIWAGLNNTADHHRWHFEELWLHF